MEKVRKKRIEKEREVHNWMCFYSLRFAETEIHFWLKLSKRVRLQLNAIGEKHMRHENAVTNSNDTHTQKMDWKFNV